MPWVSAKRREPGEGATAAPLQLRVALSLRPFLRAHWTWARRMGFIKDRKDRETTRGGPLLKWLLPGR